MVGDPEAVLRLGIRVPHQPHLPPCAEERRDQQKLECISHIDPAHLDPDRHGRRHHAAGQEAQEKDRVRKDACHRKAVAAPLDQVQDDHTGKQEEQQVREEDHQLHTEGARRPGKSVQMLRPCVDPDKIGDLRQQVFDDAGSCKGLRDICAAGARRGQSPDHQPPDQEDQPEKDRRRHPPVPFPVFPDQQHIVKHRQKHHVPLMGKAVQEVKEKAKTEEKVLALLLMHVLIEAVRHGQRKSGSHGLHKSQQLPGLIVGKARHDKQNACHEADDPASGKLCREAVEERRQRPVQHKVQRDDPLDVVSDQKELRPGCQPVDETAAGRSQRKHILEKALLSPAGPHVEIVHIVTGHPDLPVHKECPGEQDPDQDDIRPVILFLSPGSLRDIHKVYSPPVR